MKLRKFVMTLTVAALLPAFAHAGSDPVAASFDRSFYNDAYIDSCRTKQDLVVASFDNAFGNDSLINAYRIKSDLVLASFDRDMHRATENAVVTISGEPDALTAEFYAALRDVVGESVMHASAGSRIGG